MCHEKKAEARRLDVNGFPAYPKITPLPPLPSKGDRLKFAFQLIRDHGDDLADYIFAQFRHASSPEEMVRWDMLSQIVEEIVGHPLRVSYDVEARMAAEGINVETDEVSRGVGTTINGLPDC